MLILPAIDQKRCHPVTPPDVPVPTSTNFRFRAPVNPAGGTGYGRWPAYDMRREVFAIVRWQSVGRGNLGFRLDLPVGCVLLVGDLVVSYLRVHATLTSRSTRDEYTNS